MQCVITLPEETDEAFVQIVKMNPLGERKADRQTVESVKVGLC